MSLVDLSAHKINVATTTPITQEQINLLIDDIQVALNAITNDQIVDGTIVNTKIEGGTVAASLVTTTGEFNKIPKTDSSGNLIINGSIKAILG